MGSHAGILVLLAVAAPAAAALWVAYRRGWLALGPKARPLRDLSGVEAPIWLACGLLILLASMVGASMAQQVAGPLGAGEGVRGRAVVEAAGYGLAMLVGAGIVSMLIGRTSPASGTRLGWRDIGMGAAALVALAPVYIFVSQASVLVDALIAGEEGNPIKHETLTALRAQRLDSVWPWVRIAAAGIGAPVIEELTYRLGVQSFFLRMLGGDARRGGLMNGRGRARVVWASVGATTALFVPMHLGAVPLSALPSLAVFSIGAGLAYEHTGRLGVPITMHVLFNAINLAAVLGGLAG